MNKGTLITCRKNLTAQDYEHLKRLSKQDQVWSHSGVVVRGVYEGQVYFIDAISGKNIGTELTPVVDVMILGGIIKGVPVRCLERVENAEQSRD